MNNLGDLHNFGQYVSLDSSNDMFYKPRCIFWERFYFSSDSPIFTYFKNELTEKDFSFFHAHFLLSISGQNLYQEGFSKKINAKPLTNNLNFFNIGQLIAYCTIFGILDLHNGNIIYDGKNFIPIDIEVINAKIRIPSETLLLPINVQEEPYSLYSLISPHFTPHNISRLVDGLIEMFEIISNHSKNLNSLFNNFNFKKIPIRVILRHTLDYKNFSELDDLIYEEQIQLNRGDIPYFFKFIDDDKLYYFEEKNIAKVCLSRNERIVRKMKLIGNNFNILLCKDRLKNELLPNSLLQFFRFIEKDFGLLNSKTESYSYSTFEKEITIIINSKKYTTTIKR